MEEPMTIIDRFMSLSHERKQGALAIQDVSGLDAFLSESGIELTSDEKADALAFLTSGKQSLGDEELDNVAGGGGGKSGFIAICPRCGEGMIKLVTPKGVVVKCRACNYLYA
jgi:hypothetical protein